jgi:hypothetical protein
MGNHSRQQIKKRCKIYHSAKDRILVLLDLGLIEKFENMSHNDLLTFNNKIIY